MRKIILVLTFLLQFLQVFGQNLKVLNLRCEYKRDPSGVEAISPAFSWQIDSDQRNVLQSSYEILVSDNLSSLEKNKGNFWKSGKIRSGKSTQVAYQGKPLKAVTSYYWKVRIQDNKGNQSAWSAPAKWQMGLLKEDDWKNAKWIAYEVLPDSSKVILPRSTKPDKFTGSNVLPLLRKSFSISKPVKEAIIFVSGLGQFELYLNGKKVEDHFLDPGWTKYDKQALYVPFDITSALTQGPQVVGVMLGNGFYYVPPVKKRYRKLKTAFGYPKMISRLVVRYEDGTEENIVSDSTWKVSAGPITFSSIYGGEDYNANLEQNGWNTHQFDDRKWKPALETDGPAVLNAQMTEPMKIMDTFSPLSIRAGHRNSWIYDFGQNASGIVQIKARGKKGDTIRMRPVELLNEDGSPKQKQTGSPYYWEYILKGEEDETWQPRFTYYGFRYVELEGATPIGKENPVRNPEVLELSGLHIRNSAERVGSFTSSSELFNKTYTLIDWAIKSNMVSLFTDCPHREKLGWLEQTYLVGNSLKFNYDIINLCKKTLTDIQYSQLESGLVPEIAPEYVIIDWGGDVFRDSPEWGSACIILPWYLYKWYGEEKSLKTGYPVMKKYLKYLETKADGLILSQGLGDWFDIGPNRPGFPQNTPMGVTATATYYYDLIIISKIAGILGLKEDVTEYNTMAKKVKEAFNKKFYNTETKQYATGSQTANAMALYMDLVPDKDRNDVVKNLVKEIKGRNYSLTCGDIGFRYLLRVLEKEGYSDIIFEMNSRSDVPGYGFQLAKGATSLTESWQAIPEVSNNHFMLGHLMEWFFTGLGGIRQSEESVGYDKIIIKPEVVGNITHAKTEYQSVYGKISTDWNSDDDVFELKVQIPTNATAKIYLQAKEGDEITEDNKRLSNQAFKILPPDKGNAVIEVGSGWYHFKVKKSSMNN
jgi:alpha-L-rhamnosidase